MLDERARTLLKTLVERYIADGQPVGSRTLSRASGLELSPATIRNVMADLEELGLIASPHTSAGRVPTARGYRLFVDTMLTARPVSLVDVPPEMAAAREQLHPDQPQRVITQAASLLSSLSSFVGVVTAPRKASIFRHIEFLRLGERRVLVILVAPDGDVQNRVIFTARDYTQSELVEATNYLNTHYAGLSIEEVRERLKHEIEALRTEIATLMQAAVQAAGQQQLAGEGVSLQLSALTCAVGLNLLSAERVTLLRLQRRLDDLVAAFVTLVVQLPVPVLMGDEEGALAFRYVVADNDEVEVVVEDRVCASKRLVRRMGIGNREVPSVLMRDGINDDAGHNAGIGGLLEEFLPQLLRRFTSALKGCHEASPSWNASSRFFSSSPADKARTALSQVSETGAFGGRAAL